MQPGDTSAGEPTLTMTKFGALRSRVVTQPGVALWTIRQRSQDGVDVMQLASRARCT